MRQATGAEVGGVLGNGVGGAQAGGVDEPAMAFGVGVLQVLVSHTTGASLDTEASNCGWVLVVQDVVLCG